MNKHEQFHAAHIRRTPLILVNAWDAGSARTVASTGAIAIATSSWAVAAALGYDDGEQLPMARLLDVIRAIVAAVDVPVSADFECGYAPDLATLRGNIAALVATGVVGCNLEDRLPGAGDLLDVADAAARLRAARDAARTGDGRFFINARCDLFFRDARPHDDALVDEALRRADAYAQAGADGLFLPGLSDPELVRRIAAHAPLPLNLMVSAPAQIAGLAAAGAARLSFGPFGYRAAHAALRALANEAQQPR